MNNYSNHPLQPKAGRPEAGFHQLIMNAGPAKSAPSHPQISWKRVAP